MRPKSEKNEGRAGRGLLGGRDGMRFAILVTAALSLAFVVFGGDLLFSEMREPEKPESAQVLEDVPVPSIDFDLVRTAKDETPDQRYLPENEIYEHLLVRAREIMPGSLRALGMTDEPYSVSAVQRNPERYRGKPMWFSGEIQRLEPDPYKIPGLPNVRTRGLLRTDEGEPVFFAVVGDVPQQLTQGSFARVEGFFFKLRDEQFPERIVKAPFLVGKDLRPAFPRWEKVTELDPEVLARVRDATPAEGAGIEEQALYHLVSYVQNREKAEGWKAKYADLTRDDAKAILEATGEVPRGAPFRLHAALYRTRTLAAEANPLGVDFWTYAWVEHPDAGTIQVLIPGRLEGDWNINDFVVVYGHFFKRTYYETNPKHGSRHFKWAPYFVADTMLHWNLSDNPEDRTLRWVMAGITILLILTLSLLVIRDSRVDRKMREELIERRRKRRLRQSGS